MKSLVPAALVVVLEAGFLFSIASLPSPATTSSAQVVAAKAGAAAPQAPAKAAPRASRS